MCTQYLKLGLYRLRVPGILWDQNRYISDYFQEKPISIDRMLVKSKPMKKLCEHEGRGLPVDAKSDCWNDVDETEYACSVSQLKLKTLTLRLFYFQEKKRIMLRLEPPGHENAIIDNYVPIYRPGEFKFRRTEDLDLSKIL